MMCLGRKARQSAMLGISVHFLQTVFAREVEEEFGSTDVNYYEVNKRLLVGEKSKGLQVRCPRDGKLGASYVDAVHESSPESTAPATIMLSWSWGYSVRIVVGALSRWCRTSGLDPKQVFVWQCALCNNQFRVQERRSRGEWESFETFKHMFETRMDHTKRILSPMAPWDSPKNLSRIWCVFEIYMALQRGHQFEVILPDEEDDKFQHALETSGMQPIWDLFGKVDIQQADAAAEADKHNILRLVDSNLGSQNFSDYSAKCEEVNAAVVHRLQRWFVKLAVDSISVRRSQGRQIPLEAFDNVAWLLSTVRDDEESWEQTTKMYGFAVQAAEDSRSTNTEAYASVLTKYAAHLSRNNDAIARDNCLNKAGEILRRIQATDTVTFAEYLQASALRQRSVGAYDHQCQLLEEARGVLVHNNLKNTPTYASVLRYLNQCYGYQNRTFRERREIFEEAKTTWENIGCKYSTGYAGLLMNMAMAVSSSRDPRAAEWFETARKIYLRLGATQFAEYANLVQKIGRHRVYHDRHRDGLECFQEVHGIHRNVRLTKTRYHAALLADLASCQMVLKDAKSQSTFKQARNLVNELQNSEENGSAEYATLGRLREKLQRWQNNGGRQGPPPTTPQSGDAHGDPVRSASDDELDRPVPRMLRRRGVLSWLCGRSNEPVLPGNRRRSCLQCCFSGSGCMSGLSRWGRRSVPPAGESSQQSPPTGCGCSATRACACACCALGLLCMLHP